ncbi:MULTISPECIES: hypothetical protein [unclassified Streptomyces]|uniref:hypothetical protein n=1 Tax=unclassified Streptomyces TaxID=2593676 RepID=UPI00081E8C7F|nr:MULTISPECIES: hypothetical protein [unclassified Streptomyces]MYZ38695.1 hypothetical protein [Streptomyces sp. SID4917]SCF99883.1 hypothetical protein GA0115259_106785 [Streptomyces sp. MnatMP-M17]
MNGRLAGGTLSDTKTGDAQAGNGQARDGQAQEKDLLEAGAVLPLGGAEGDTLTARAYGHPALDERAVVRLVPGAIGAAEDLALEYLGFGAAEAVEVGRVKRQSLGFPAWALVHDPDNGHHALAVVKEMERLTRQVATKPGLAKEGFDEIGERLDRSVPHFLPTFYEQVARLFLAVESRQQASVFFGKARAAEQRHALAVDEERLREVFLEFAGAGALSGKALREHAKGLTDRLSAEEAYSQFKAVSLERCAAGLAPYAGMLEDLRRLAKGAGLDAAAEERTLLAEIIHTGPMNRAAASFWKSALPALRAVAAEDRAVRERLLALLPATGGDSHEEFDASWLALLDQCGAIDLLVDGTVPAAEWLSSWARHRQRGWRSSKRLPAELALVERLVERLVADGTPVRLLGRRGRRVMADLDLLDACLAWGVPVDGPPEDAWNLALDDWLGDAQEGRRDLVALTSDPRFTRLIRTGVERLADQGDATERLREIAAHPALRGALVGWLDDRADDLARPFGLPELHGLLTRLSRFSSPSVLATAPEAVARITAVSPAPALARTLRAGILDELGWPALEEALPGLGKVSPRGSGQRYGYQSDRWYRVRDAWPALLVRVDTQVAAVGPSAVVDRRTLPLPAKSVQTWDTITVRYVGGQWLIANGLGDDRRALWSGRPSEVFKPTGELHDHWTDSQVPSLELSGGGRCYGGRPVYAGDTSFAGERRQVASDGISVWVLHENQWWEYDPESARRGRVSVPAFFDSALDSAPAGGGVRLLERACRLLPVQPGLESSPFGTKDGLLGWWVTYDPKERTLTACSVDGSRSPAVPVPPRASLEHLNNGLPVPPLRLPGGAVLHPRETRGFSASVTLYDTEGIQLAEVEEGDRGGAYAAGTPLVAPLAHWHALRPRDERGSAALRAVTEARARELLTAVAEGTKAKTAVRRILPEITHPGLVAGVAGVVAEAARHGKRIGTLAEQAARGRRGAEGPREPEVEHAQDGILKEACDGFTRPTYRYSYHPLAQGSTTIIEQIRLLPEVLAPDAVPGRVALKDLSEGWVTLCGAGMAALAVRAASPAVADEHRAALVEFLDSALAVESGGDALLIDPRGRLRAVELKIAGESEDKRAGEVRHAGDRRLLILGRLRYEEKEAYWHCVEYDPAGAFGGWDGCTVVESEVLGAADDPVRAPAVRRLLELVRERGPLPYRPEQAVDFAEQVGITPVAGALFQLGSPGLTGYHAHGTVSAEYLEPLGAKKAEAQVGVATLMALSVEERRAFTALLLPGEPARVADLWTTGFAVEPLVGAWTAVRGRRRPTPASLIRPMVAEMGGGTAVDDALNPECQPWLMGRTEQRLVDGELETADPGLALTGSRLHDTVGALRWLAYRLPYGDPLRAVLPETVRKLRERLADPGLLLDLGVSRDSAYDAVSPRLREAFGLAPKRGGGEKEITELSSALVLTPTRYGRDWDSVWVRPAALLPVAGATGEGGASQGGTGGGETGEGGPDHPDLKLLVATAGPAPSLEALRAVLSEEFMELVTADGPPGAQQNPLHTVPELVGETAERFGLSEDAAALYLMLLALPDPTDRQQAAWTGWKPARLKKARAELAATDLVVEAKRARAGRTLFLPGGWLEQQTPRLPSENWKTALLPWDRPGFVVPDRPVPAQFEAAWRRVAEGDAPGFEEFRGRSVRGGRR